MSDNLKSGKVTIVIPVYNRQDLIGPCIESALRQTYENIKILVVDDGSTDSTRTVVQQYMERDSRIELATQEVNTGSMNKALHDSILSCDTEFFTWIGSDDTYIPSAISQMVAQHRLHPAVDYVSYDLKMTEAGKDYCPYCSSAWPNWSGFASMSPFKQYDKSSFVSLVYRSLCPPFPLNGMGKTSFFRNRNLTWVEYKGNTWSPDTLNALRFFSKDMTMVHYNEFPLVIYRKHSGQDTVTGAVGEQIRCDITLIEAIFEWFPLNLFLNPEELRSGKHVAFLDRLKRLALDHAGRHESTPLLKRALSDLSAKAHLYLWENKKEISLEAYESLSSFFKEYL